jgi:hypothetical protein
MDPSVRKSSTLVDNGQLTLLDVAVWLQHLDDEGFGLGTKVKIVRNRSNPFVGALKVEERS